MFIFRSFIYARKRKTTDIQCFAFILSDPGGITTTQTVPNEQIQIYTLTPH